MRKLGKLFIKHLKTFWKKILKKLGKLEKIWIFKLFRKGKNIDKKNIDKKNFYANFLKKKKYL